MDNKIAEVKIWDRTVGYVQDVSNRTVFKYASEVIDKVKSNTELSCKSISTKTRSS